MRRARLTAPPDAHGYTDADAGPSLRNRMQSWVIVYAIGAAHAALLVPALWRRRANAQANRLLAAWLALVAADLTVRAAWIAVPSPSLSRAYALVSLFPFLHASLFYLYVRTLTTGRRMALRDLLHLAGFAIALAVSIPAWTASGRQQPASLDIGLFVYAFAYVAAALSRIVAHHRQLRRFRADADRQSMRWLVALAACQLAIWAIAALQLMVEQPVLDHRWIYGAVAAWSLVVGWFSLAQPPVVALATGDAAGIECGGAQPPAGMLDDARAADVQARLEALMTGERLFTAPALTIGQLARRSGYPEYLVSAVINRRFGENFWEYVNRHRIQAASAFLADPEDTRTILDIAYACGFTSKSTFNAAFKRLHGRTPSAYRQSPAAAAVATGAGAAGIRMRRD
jgi:AraC-like DNA-binding protein